MDLSSFFPPSLLDQSFGLCISPDDLIFPSYNFHRTNYYRPWKWYMQRAEKDFGSTIHNEKDRFKIALDVQHFQPEEINVRVADREIIIEGKHEERQDNHGFISRQFKRRYFLPHECDAESVFSSLSSDGVLTITADKIREIKNKEVIVPIKMCDTCPSKDLKTKIEKKEQIMDEIKQVGSEKSKNKMEVMLKEDHCCLLRPELLGAPSSIDKVQSTIAADNFKILAADKSEQATNLKVSDKLEIASGQLSATKAELTSTEKSETIVSGAAKSEKIEAGACGVTSGGITDKISSGMISSGVTEKAFSGMTSAEKIDKAETLLCGLSSTGKTEKSGTLISGSTSTGKAEQSEMVACGITSEILTEKAETSAAAKSEMCNMRSMINETIQIQESSSCYSSSMAASIKETTEKISEIVSDISAQLKEAAENI